MYKPRDVQEAWQAAEAEVLAAQATLLAAQNGERRAQKLLDAGAAAPSDLEAAEAAHSAAEARVQAAEAAANRAKEDAEKLDVPAPINGSVSRTQVHAGPARRREARCSRWSTPPSSSFRPPFPRRR